MGKELTDQAVLDELVAAFGTKRAIYLLGWSAAFVALGALDRQAMLDAPIGGQSTRYRVVADLTTVRRILISKGYDMDAEVSASPTHLVAPRAIPA